MISAHLSLLFVLGVGAFAGLLGAWLFQRLHIPQVVGYICIGLAIGLSGLGLVDAEHLESLQSFNLLALGIIGFLVGGELRLENFRKYGRQYAGIVVGEGCTAFLLAGGGIGILLYLVTQRVAPALAGGLVFGAIASATDPASTVDVLWEKRARGVLTSAIVAIVALDDALAMTLYGIGRSVATLLVGGEGHFGREAVRVTRELGGALVVGVVLAIVLAFLLRRLHDRDRRLAISVGTVLLAIGTAAAFDLDVILTTMAMGMALANLAPRRSEELFRVLRSMSIPIYVLFFVLVGARLAVGQMPLWLWGVVAIYVIGRTLGKFGGAWVGAKLTKAPAVVRDNVGLGLGPQGGVAVGLAIVASQHLATVTLTPELSLGQAVVFGVTATTLVMQLGGPPLVWLAARRAGETDRAITEEDVLGGWHVRDVMVPEPWTAAVSTPLRALIAGFAEHDQAICPVVDSAGKLTGIVAFDALKDVLPEEDTWEWLVAADIARAPQHMVAPDAPLANALQTLDDLQFDQLPVCDAAGTAIGVLDRRRTHRLVAEEILRRQGGV